MRKFYQGINLGEKKKEEDIKVPFHKIFCLVSASVAKVIVDLRLPTN